MLMIEPDVDLVVSLARFVERRGVLLRPCADVVTAQAALRLGGVHGVVCALEVPGARDFLATMRTSQPRILRVASGRMSAKSLRTVLENGLAHTALAKPIDVEEFVTCCTFAVPGHDAFQVEQHKV